MLNSPRRWRILRKKTVIEKVIEFLEKHSSYIGIFLILVAASAILAGAIYAVVHKVPPMLMLENQLIVIVPVTSQYYGIIRQTASETLGMVVLFLLGSLGGILMIESSNIVKSQRLLNIVFGIGALLFTVSATLTVIVYAYAKGWGL